MLTCREQRTYKGLQSSRRHAKGRDHVLQLTLDRLHVRVRVRVRVRVGVRVRVRVRVLGLLGPHRPQLSG